MAKILIDRTALTLSMCVLIAMSAIPIGQAIWLNLPSSGTKCVSEEIHTNVVVLADYMVIAEDHTPDIPTISIKVTSPYGNNLHHKENVTQGQFAFTTIESGNYLACFWVDGHKQGGPGASVNLDWKTGIAAKDWETVARKEKIEVGDFNLVFEFPSFPNDGVELELKKLEGAVEAIHDNLLFLKSRYTCIFLTTFFSLPSLFNKLGAFDLYDSIDAEFLSAREAEMRQVSETTNTRVAWFSIMSLGLCILASAVQVWHLKHYFRKKKLI
ncbi:hypothetical protein Sjap_021519 [Stephania japonica]|uniref:GOLD domain-containing protein n=1 Tax=Stephania japonica TaxID=461633 RepID=A0AAP0EQ99_9MAGN